MSEMRDNTDQRLEGLLRQWGADEAGRSARAHLEPSEPPRRLWGPVLLRWAPSAAAAVLLLAAGTVFLAWRAGRDQPDEAMSPGSADQAPEAPASPTAEQVQAQIRKIIAENEKLKSERDGLQGAMDRIAGQHAAALKTLRDDHGALQTQFREQGEKSQLARSTAIERAKQAEGQLKVSKAELATVAADRDRARADLKTAGTQAGRLKTRVDELTRREGEIRKEYGAAAKALAEANEKAAAELAQARRRNELLRKEFQRLYLAVGAPGQTGLAALKTTLRRMRLIERGTALGRQCDDERLKALLNRVDVALTRLDMLDPGDAGAVKRFTASVGASALAARIDDALALGPDLPGLASYLREAQMILTGVEGVG